MLLNIMAVSHFAKAISNSGSVQPALSSLSFIYSRQCVCTGLSYSSGNENHKQQDSSFTDNRLPSKLVDRLAEQNIWTPNELQKKVLPDVLEGRCAVVNAETGSGKTLCYLLPILSRMYEYQAKKLPIPRPLAAVVVPTPELAHQVNSVYQTLAHPKWSSSVAHVGSRLHLKASTHLVVLTGSTLHKYYFPHVFKEVEVLVLDEVDALLTGSERSTLWNLLEFFKQKLLLCEVNSKAPEPCSIQPGEIDTSLGITSQIHCDAESETVTPSNPSTRTRPGKSHITRKGIKSNHSITSASDCVGVEGSYLDRVGDSFPFQFIFAGATLPNRGRMTVDALLRTWAPPSTSFITTSRAHRHVEGARFEFIRSDNTQEKNASLFGILQSFLSRKCHSEDNVVKKSVSTSNNLKVSIRDSSSVDSAPDSLDSPHKNAAIVFCNDESIVERLFEVLTISNSRAGEQIAISRKTVGKVHAELAVDDRLKIVNDFRSGNNTRILICTNVLSRGLDLPQVGLVVHYNCPRNVSDFLHRSGRTARLGRIGRVVCYYDESTEPIVELIQETMDSPNQTFDHLFSRNTSLGRKLKRRGAGEHAS